MANLDAEAFRCFPPDSVYCVTILGQQMLRQTIALPLCAHLPRHPLLPQRRHPRRLRRLDVEFLARPVVSLDS